MRDLFSQPVPDQQPERRILTVGELNQAIETALRDAFRGAVWVRGEVQRLNRNRSGHIYFELHGADGSGIDQVRVAALKWDRDRFGLDRWFDGSDPDLCIRDNLEVCLQGRVTYHPKWGLSLQLVGVDAEATLGQLEARRRRTLAWLKEQGLLERNAALAIPDLPLRVGLVTSDGSAAEADFLRTLRDSGYAFTVQRADCRMTGDQMAVQVSTAVTALGRADVDVVVVTRGGGAKADLAWFDHPEVCAAVARCARPVITAIGHEIDQSLTDVVAHHHCKTPTAAAGDLVERVAVAERRLERAAEGVVGAAVDLLDDARDRLWSAARSLRGAVTARVRGEAVALVRLREGVSREVRRRLGAERASLADRPARVAAATRRRLERERRDMERRAAGLSVERLLARWPRRTERLDTAAARLGRLATSSLATRGRTLDHLEEKARLLDPARLLDRGFSLTTDVDGRIVRSAVGVGDGDRLVTRLRDGAIESIVERTRPDEGTEGGTE